MIFDTFQEVFVQKLSTLFSQVMQNNVVNENKIILTGLKKL